MKGEYETNELRTCVLYPSNDAAYVHDWISAQERFTQSSDNKGTFNTNSDVQAISKPPRYRIIALDGTYPQVWLYIAYWLFT